MIALTLLLLGLNFFITEIPYEVFTYNELDVNPIHFEEKSKDVYPYMVKFILQDCALHNTKLF